jgi:Uncharacterized conserved protein
MQFEIHQEGVTRLTSLRNGGGDWRWELVNEAGDIVAEGRDYRSKAACREAVEALRATNGETHVVNRA